MICEITNRDQLPTYRGGSCTSQAPIFPGDYLTCRIQFNYSSVVTQVLAGSGATNDTNGGSQPTAGNNPSATSLVAPQPEMVVADVPLGRMTSGLLGCLLLLGGWLRLSKFHLRSVRTLRARGFAMFVR